MNEASLLRSIAGRLQNGVGELRRDFLEGIADKLDKLETAAKAAGVVAASVPRNGKDALKSMVPRILIHELIEALNEAGAYGPDGGQVKERRVSHTKENRL